MLQGPIQVMMKMLVVALLGHRQVAREEQAEVEELEVVFTTPPHQTILSMNALD